MAASPLHDVATEEDESKSSSAMFVTPQLDEEGESKDDQAEKTAAVEPKDDQTEKTAAVESKDDGTEKTAAVESEDDGTEKTAVVEAQDLPAASGAASPEAAAPAPTASKAPPAMPKVEEQPGFFAGLTGHEKRDYMNERNERLKKEIRDQIQARIDKHEADRIAKEQADRIATAALADEQPEKPEQGSFEEPGSGAAPFNVFGATPPVAPTMANVKEEQNSESEEEQMLVVNDLRKCAKCGGKSYIRQGLCVNIYCALYFMGRANAGTRLQARGKIGDGGQWSPRDWYSPGNFSKVEDELLRNEWKDQVHQLKGLPAPKEEGNVPKPGQEIFGKEPIVIEDLETGEVQTHGEVIDKSPMEAPVEKVPRVDPMSQAVKGIRYKVRNKGLKRLRTWLRVLKRRSAKENGRGLMCLCLDLPGLSLKMLWLLWLRSAPKMASDLNMYVNIGF